MRVWHLLQISPTCHFEATLRFYSPQALVGVALLRFLVNRTLVYLTSDDRYWRAMYVVFLLNRNTKMHLEKPVGTHRRIHPSLNQFAVGIDLASLQTTRIAPDMDAPR